MNCAIIFSSRTIHPLSAHFPMILMLTPCMGRDVRMEAPLSVALLVSSPHSENPKRKWNENERESEKWKTEKMTIAI